MAKPVLDIESLHAIFAEFAENFLRASSRGADDAVNSAYVCGIDQLSEVERRELSKIAKNAATAAKALNQYVDTSAFSAYCAQERAKESA